MMASQTLDAADDTRRPVLTDPDPDARNLPVSHFLLAVAFLLADDHVSGLFSSQAKMVEAIDALSRKVESLTHTVSSIARGSPSGSANGGSASGGM